MSYNSVQASFLNCDILFQQLLPVIHVHVHVYIYALPNAISHCLHMDKYIYTRAVMYYIYTCI